MWKDWNDYYMLIEPHDDEDEGLEEGLEAFGAAPDYEEGAENEDLDEDGEEGGIHTATFRDGYTQACNQNAKCIREPANCTGMRNEVPD